MKNPNAGIARSYGRIDLELGYVGWADPGLVREKPNAREHVGLRCAQHQPTRAVAAARFFVSTAGWPTRTGSGRSPTAANTLGFAALSTNLQKRSAAACFLVGDRILQRTLCLPVEYSAPNLLKAKRAWQST